MVKDQDATTDAAMNCRIRRRHDEATRLLVGVDPEILRSQDIGACNWNGMTAEEIELAMIDSSVGCANPSHRFFLQRAAGMPNE